MIRRGREGRREGGREAKVKGGRARKRFSTHLSDLPREKLEGSVLVGRSDGSRLLVDSNLVPAKREKRESALVEGREGGTKLRNEK